MSFTHKPTQTLERRATAPLSLPQRLRAMHDKLFIPGTTVSLQDTADLLAAAKELDGYYKWEQSINEAMNSGAGTYHP